MVVEALRRRLSALSPRSPQLWVVSTLSATDPVAQARSDYDAASEGGACAVLFVNRHAGPDRLEAEGLSRAISDALDRRGKNGLRIGVNYLGEGQDPNEHRTSFRLARDLGLDIVWTDLCGVDRIREREAPSLLEIQDLRDRTDAFYVSGIQMKYTTLVDETKPLEQSALQAMGFLDGMVVTGEATGRPPDVEDLRRVREAIGAHPLGIGSGMTAENAPVYAPFLDFAIVGTSLRDETGRTLASEVRRLRQALDRQADAT